MKFLKIFSSMLIATAMCCFISGCSDDDDNTEPVNPTEDESISVSPTSVTFDVLGTARTVTVTANAAWSVDAPDWVSASPASGSANAEVKLTADNNYSEDGSEERSDVVIFRLDSGEGEVSVSVTQDGNEAGEPEPDPTPEPDPETETLSVTPTELSFENAGGEGTLTVTATGAWTVSGAPDWVTLSAESGDADATVTVTASSNYSESGSEARTGTLTFSLTSGDAEYVTVTLTQEGNEAGAVEPEPEPQEEIVYFEDDFDWVKPYATAAGEPDIFGDKTVDGFSATAFSAVTVDGKTCQEDFIERGYHAYLKGTTTEDTYLVPFPGYFYVYENNSSHIIAIYLPTLGKRDSVPAEDAPVYVDFKWSAGCDTSMDFSKYDIQLVLVVKNGESETEFEVPTSVATKEDVRWTDVSIELKGVTIDESTEFIVHPTDGHGWDETAKTSHLWFFDDFKIYTPAAE